MPNIKQLIKRMLTGLPIVTIVAATFFPLQARGQQALVLFVLIWYYVFMIFDVLGK